ncbi:MAG: hypothetical protein Kow0042_06300 [Calditrichia bacterium]
MIRLVNKHTGRQFLLEPQSPDKCYKRPHYGAKFDDYDTSGFDECLPTIEACQYPFADKETQIFIPDHGELWSIPWRYERGADSIYLAASGHIFSYLFEKQITLRHDELILDYQITNQAEETLYFLWSAHPLLQVSSGCQIVLGREVREVFLNWSSDPNMGEFADRLTWPFLLGESTEYDFSRVQAKSFGRAVKCFTDVLTEGWAGVYYPESDESLLFEFDTQSVPYLGIWMCYGGWPPDSPQKHLTVALEPCSGRPDSLAESIARGECTSLQPNQRKAWSIKMRMTRGLPVQGA